MYQRLMPDTSQTLQAVGARCAAEIEAVELELARLQAVEADLRKFVSQQRHVFRGTNTPYVHVSEKELDALKRALGGDA